jgi:predicted RNA binding protein YcfA (HicA-like mRNA interferase family)
MKVREVIRMIQADGWTLERTVGSHRQFRHPSKIGTVTIAGNMGKELKPGTLASVRRQAGLQGDRKA